MRNLFFKLFEMSHFNTGISVTAFSLSHIIYILLIAGAIVGLFLAFRKKGEDKTEKVLRILAYAVVISYLSDFFVHDFVYADLGDSLVYSPEVLKERGGLNMDKLPFHICTVLCPIMAFTQFNKRFKKFLEPVAMLSIVAPLMYLCYPASIGSGEPWCYQAVQTMFYHGALLAWGILSVAYGKVKPSIKKSWHAAILLVAITLWAKLGNILLEHNWFFLNEDAFYIGLVAGGIIPKWLLMVINPIAFFLVILAVYGIIYAIRAIIKKTKKA